MTALAAAPEPQTSLDEVVVDDEALLAKVKAFDDARTAGSAAARATKTAKSVLEEAFDQLDLATDQPVRVGDYLLVRRHVEGTHRSFDVPPNDRLYVRRTD